MLHPPPAHVVVALLERKERERPKQGEKKVRSPRAPNQHDIFSDTPNTKTSKQAVFLSLILFLFGEQTIFEFQYFFKKQTIFGWGPPLAPPFISLEREMRKKPQGLRWGKKKVH